MFSGLHTRERESWADLSDPGVLAHFALESMVNSNVLDYRLFTGNLDIESYVWQIPLLFVYIITLCFP